MHQKRVFLQNEQNKKINKKENDIVFMSARISTYLKTSKSFRTSINFMLEYFKMKKILSSKETI